MPSSSKKQHNLMAAVAHDPSFAKKMGIPQSVGEDFSNADKGMKFSGGVKSRADSQAVNQPKTQHGSEELFKKGGFMKKMAKGGMSETMGPRGVSEDVEKGSNKKKPHGEHGIEKRGATRAMMPKMKGNMIGDGPEVNTMKKGGKVKKYAKGGFVYGEPMEPVTAGGKKGRGEHSIQQKGLTKGKYC